VNLLEQSFALGGTVTQAGSDIAVTLRGGRLGTSLDARVQLGAVLAVSRVTQQGDAIRAARMPWTLLEVTSAPRDGVVRCRLWRRYQEDNLHEEPAVLGYRCQVLRTVQTQVRLRLLDEDTGQPMAGAAVYVSQPGGKTKAELSTDRNGLAVTAERFSRFALVQVGQGGGARAQLPVELVDERTVVCRLKARPDAEVLAGLEVRRDQWLRRVYEQLRLAGERVPELNLRLGKSLQDAVDHARRSLPRLDAALEQLEQERDQLARLVRDHKPAATLDLAEGDQRLAELKLRREELHQFIGRIEATLKDAQSEGTQALSKLLERARLMEQEANFDQAIELYESVLEARGDQENVKAHLAKLKAAWAVKDPRHAKAREFLVQTWPRLETAALADHLEQAEEALATCREAGDGLTPLRLMQANTAHVARLKEKREALRRQNTEDTPNQLKLIGQLAEGLKRLHAQASEAAAKK
jgi:hypothetical protein